MQGECGVSPIILTPKIILFRKLKQNDKIAFEIVAIVYRYYFEVSFSFGRWRRNIPSVEEYRNVLDVILRQKASAMLLQLVQDELKVRCKKVSLPIFLCYKWLTLKFEVTFVLVDETLPIITVFLTPMKQIP
jgi:hypothetical protein